jgi:ribosomal protein L7/L12
MADFGLGIADNPVNPQSMIRVGEHQQKRADAIKNRLAKAGATVEIN